MKLLKSFAITAVILAVPLTSYGWTRTYGGPDTDVGYWVEQTQDGGYVMTGELAKPLHNDTVSYVWLIKTDAEGDTLWTRTYGGEFIYRDCGRCVQITSDGGYILTGEPWALIKTDAWGDTLWTREYQGYYGCVLQTSDGGYVLKSVYYGTILKTDEQGDSLWCRTYGIRDDRYFHAIEKTSDSGFVITGRAWYYDNYEGCFFLIKADSCGDSMWVKIWDVDGVGASIQQTTDGGYVIAGSLHSQLGRGRDYVWLVKTDGEGDTLWTQTYGGEPYDNAQSVQQTSDEGFVIVGTKTDDIWLLKTDGSGDTMWTRTYSGESFDRGWCVRQTLDGGYVAVGEKRNYPGGYDDLWLLKTNEYGDTVWYEGSPREILEPQEGDTISYMIPAAWFKNTGTYPIQDFYCHCEIWPWSGDSAACAYLSPPYHVKYWVSYEVEPGDSVLVKFSEWYSDDSSKYRASFYTTKDEEPIWSTNPKTVSFQGTPYIGVIEDKPAQASPSWGLISSCGPKIILKYSNYPQGFSASIFDVAGRQVDELETSGSSGLITWGEGCVVGVYFIRASGSQAKEVKRFIIMR